METTNIGTSAISQWNTPIPLCGHGEGLVNVVVMDECPLLRVGLTRVLESMQGIGAIQSIDPDDLTCSMAKVHDADLLVFGMPHDAATGWRQLRQLRRNRPGQRLLLLVDNIWQRTTPDMGLGMHYCLPKTTEVVFLESAIQHVLQLEMLTA